MSANDRVCITIVMHTVSLYSSHRVADGEHSGKERDKKKQYVSNKQRSLQTRLRLVYILIEPVRVRHNRWICVC